MATGVPAAYGKSLLVTTVTNVTAFFGSLPNSKGMGELGATARAPEKPWGWSQRRILRSPLRIAKGTGEAAAGTAGHTGLVRLDMVH